MSTGNTSADLNPNVVSSNAQYYGQVLQKSQDLKTSACCTDPSSIPTPLKRLLSQIHDEVLIKYYGCGSPIPSHAFTR